MKISFGESLRRSRMRRGFSQQQLANKLGVERSTVSNWEADRRIPDIDMIARLAEYLEISSDELLSASAAEPVTPNVIMIDDERLILNGSLAILRRVMPYANIKGFTSPAAALGFAEKNKTDIVFLDIEMGHVSGLDVCRELIGINPQTNVIYLTAYREYAFDAWGTGAVDYILKPLTEEAVRKQLDRLRYPIGGISV